mmetsp:Transcript_47385/g.94817  ORF Transcript_47385/g.94817 Transcript_47385/m.94817 type:complete len:178 (+) Transcript_47385:86-619(+)|eukprot:CAMPEP_0196733872 /NCGR_PEP_ID=MMETSP1091-20130531/12770_1 /TAXON_ID=302021 /ORGANISM="Rhodomonas sp., Strain CCMP768" /LENGTH=177 /DNA_ID=CAMNT_0042077295 /DNA_START=86 /DNA_END=619 /DNA_ORIENTATION=+
MAMVAKKQIEPKPLPGGMGKPGGEGVGGKKDVLSLKRINLYDSTSGKCLYEKRFAGNEEGAPSAGIGSFVSVLYQFAREVDYGSISRVMYDGGDRRGPADSPQANGPGPEMVTERRDGVIISVFHCSFDHTLVRRFAHHTLNEFLLHHKQPQAGKEGEVVECSAFEAFLESTLAEAQ